MLQGIMNNAGTVAVILVLAGIIAAVIVILRRDKRKGKSSCGGTCGCCPMAGSCHKK